VTTYLGKKIGWLATNSLRTDLVIHCLNMDMAFHKSLRPGELIERIDGDVNTLLNFFAQFAIVVVNNILLILGILILLFREDSLIGITETIFVIITAIVLVKVKSIGTPHWKKVRDISGKLYGFLGEHVSSTEDIKSNGATSYTMNHFYGLLRKLFPVQFKASISGYSLYMSTLVLTGVSNTIAFGLGGYLWSKGIISIGTVYLFYNYNQLLISPIDQVRRQLQDFQRAAASIERVNELLARKSKLVDGTGAELTEGPFDVYVNNIDFEYEEDVAVLKNISFKLQKGKVLGILGRTGSGKTTMARLLTRLYDPTKGELYYGEQLAKDIPLRSLRDKVAYVTQDVQLFNASVRDNITFFNKKVKDEVILPIINEIGLSSWFDSLPEGLNTVLDPNGSNLSAGEAQLLAIVRVFLKNPSLVILDEASSRLDPATESLIQVAISKLLMGRSGIIIAHRLSTVNNVDDIMILEEGKILEFDNRKVLEGNSNSVFYNLLRTGMEEVLA
jgi:ABC-type multidrug transport system fused ATPase/permease subunit